MQTAQRRQTKVALGQGLLSLLAFGRIAGAVRSPYFHTTDTRKEASRNIRFIPEHMNLKALITGYTISGPQPNVSLFFESDDSSIEVGTVLPVSIAYGDNDVAIQAKIATVINTFCSSNSLPTPTIDWLFTTPTDLAAAIAALPTAPTSYQTIVSQTGTAAPAVSGSLAPVSTYPAGTTFTWARTSAGVYTLTASTAVFNTSGKTGVFVAPLQNLNASVKAVVTSTTVITVTTAVQSVAVLGLLGLTTTATDALLSGTMIYVQTYS